MRPQGRQSVDGGDVDALAVVQVFQQRQDLGAPHPAVPPVPAGAQLISPARCPAR